MKSLMENAVDQGSGRGGWRRDGGLKSQIEDAWDDCIGRGRGRVEGGLKSNLENGRQYTKDRGGV